MQIVAIEDVSPAPESASITAIMREVLSKTNDVSVPCEQLEYYHLQLLHCDDAGEPWFCVAGFRERWDPSRERMVFDDEKSAAFATLEEAKKGYVARRAELARRGFIYSDMDMF